jgi:PGF-pre-PGF domain-containing protein
MGTHRAAAVLFAVLMITSVVAVPWTAAAQQSEPDDPDSPPASYYGSVTIDGDPAPAGTTVEAVVDGEVVGSITTDEAGEYGGAGAFEEKLRVGRNASIENGSGVRFFVDNDEIDRTEVGTTTPSTVTFEPGDVQQVDLRVALADSLFEVDIVDAPADSVNAGKDADLTLNITNAGASRGTQTVELRVGNETRTTVTETLDVGKSTERLASVPTEVSDAPNVTIVADTGDDTASTTVDIDRPPEFAVALGLNDTRVAPGQFINGTATVTNVGGQSATRNVTVTIGDTEISTTEVRLGADETRAVDFGFRARPRDAGTQRITARTDDDSNASVVAVSEPAEFEVNVIEVDSKLDVVTNETAALVAEVENVGGARANKSVTITRGERELANESFNLSAGEFGVIRTEVSTDADDADVGGFDLTVASPDDFETANVSVEDTEAFLDVTINEISESVDEPFPGNTTNVTADVTVENLGTENVTRDIEFRIDGDVRETRSFEENGALNLNDVQVPIRNGEAPGVDLTVASGSGTAADDTETEQVAVNATPEFDVTIVEAANRSQLSTDTPFAPTINVTNVGDQVGNGTLIIRFNDSVERIFSLSSSAAGATNETVQPNEGFSINASTATARILEAEVVNNGTDAIDDLSTRRVTIGEAANFTIESFSPPDTVDQGEQLTLRATINNTGEVNATQTVAIEFGGTTLNATSLELGNVTSGDNTATITGTLRASAGDIGDNTVTVSTADSEVERTVTVRETAEFEVVEVDAPDEAIANDAADVSVTVENVGGNASNTTTLRLIAGGDQVATRSLTLDAGEVRLVEFDDGEVTPGAAGDLDIVAATGDDAGSDTIDVGADGDFAYELVSVTDPATTNSTLEATVSAENVGDGRATETVSFAIDGRIVDRATASAAGGETTRVTLQNATGSSAEDVTIAAFGPDAVIDTETVSIKEPPEGPDYRVSNVDVAAPRTSNGAVLDVAQTVTVTADITNIGDQNGDQAITLSVDAADENPLDTDESVTLDNGSATTVSLTFNTTNVTVDGTEDVTVTVASESEDRSDSATVTVTEPTPGSASIVSTELASQTATQDERFAVNATIENAGDLDLNGTVEIDYDDGAATDSVDIQSLGPDNTKTVTLGVAPPAEPRAGTFERDIEITASSESDADAESVTRTVPVDFGSIQSGVAAASEDGTVEIADGTYRERNEIEVDVEGLTLRGVGGTPTVQSPRNADTALEVTAADVTVANVEFVGDGSGTGVVLDATNASLLGVDARNWAAGIEETDASGANTIRGSTVIGSGTAIVLDGDGGTVIEFVRIVGSADRGLVIRAPNTDVFGATVLGSTLGIDVRGVTGTTIEASIVRGNDDAGIRVADAPTTLENPSGDVRTSANIRGSAIESNGIDAIITNTSVGAAGNWWGSPGNPVENVDYVVRSNFTTNASNSRPASNFEVSLDTVPDTVARDSAFTIEATVENTGTKPDLQTVSLTRQDGTVVDSTDVELNASGSPGDSTTVDLAYTPTVSDGNSVNLTVSSLDDSQAASTVDIPETSFEVPSAGIPSSITEGDTLTVSPTIDNVGGVGDTQTVGLVIDGNTVDSESVTLSGLDDTQVTLSDTPDASAGDTLDVAVVTDDASESGDVDVDADGDEEEEESNTGPTGGPDTDDDVPAPTEEIGAEPTNIESVTPEVDVDAGQAVATFEASQNVESIALDTTESISEVTVSELDPDTDTETPAPGQPVSLQDITVSGADSDASDTPATIRFRISNEQLDATGAAAENLRAFRLVDGDWQRLETSVVEGTDGRVVLEAQTPGFSVFAVSAVTPPEGSIALDPGTATVDSDVGLSGAESTDPDGEIVAYEWSVGGETLTGETVTVSRSEPGEYTVELVVTDDAGETDTVTETLVVEAADTATATPEPDTAEPDVQPPDEGPTEEPDGFDILPVVVVAVVLLLGAGYVAYRRRER